MSVEHWLKVHSTQTWGRWPSEDVVAAVCRHVPVHSARFEALDLGAGVGSHTRMLLEEGWNVYSVECSPLACRKLEDIANRMWTVQLPKVVCHDLNNYDWPRLLDSPFQIIIDNFTLCHLDSIDIFKKNLLCCLARLQPGGLMISRHYLSQKSYGDHPALTEDKIYYALVEAIHVAGLGYKLSLSQATNAKSQAIRHWEITRSL